MLVRPIEVRVDDMSPGIGGVKICFVLPCSGRYPIGGFRIIYEYANRLADRGHAVTLVHLIATLPKELPWLRRWKARLQFLRDKVTRGYLPKRWFALNPAVRTTCHFTLKPGAVPQGHAVVASAWQTAEGVSRLDESHGRKYYFIQHYEGWNSDAPRLLKTWTLPLRKVVIAKWLGDIAADLGEPYELVPNAVDLSFFTMRRTPEDRPPRSILLQSHKMDWKGTRDAIQALRLLKQRGVDFDLTLFGLKPPGELGIDLPHRFVFNPPQTILRDLYNDNAIFVAASWSEGWGLTAHEAAACGAALAVTDIGGHREFLIPNRSALMSPPKDPVALADNIQALLQDETLRNRLALQAHADVQGFTWHHSAAAFEKVLS